MSARPVSPHENALALVRADAAELAMVESRCQAILKSDPDHREALRAVEAASLAVGAARDYLRSIESDIATGVGWESPRTRQLRLAAAAARIEAGTHAVLAGAVAPEDVRGL